METKRLALPLYSYIDPDKSPLNRANREWITFIQDHKNYLLKTATGYELDYETIARYRYRLRLFLEDKQIPYEHLRIIRIINDLYTDTEFNKPMTLYVPEYNRVNDLYIQYESMFN